MKHDRDLKRLFLKIMAPEMESDPEWLERMGDIDAMMTLAGLRT